MLMIISVQRPHMKEFLSAGVVALQIEDVKRDICSEGSSQGLLLTLKPTEALSGDDLEKLVNGLRCHFHKLHLIHPWVSPGPEVGEQRRTVAVYHVSYTQKNHQIPERRTVCVHVLFRLIFHCVCVVCVSVCLFTRFALR